MHIINICINGYLKCRLYCVDWKQWRESHKSLILLEFLLTHGPEDFAEEFVSDTDVIEELRTFRYIDDKGYALISKKNKCDTKSTIEIINLYLLCDGAL